MLTILTLTVSVTGSLTLTLLTLLLSTAVNKAPVCERLTIFQISKSVIATCEQRVET